MEEDTLYLQLHKLTSCFSPAAATVEKSNDVTNLEGVLQTLWQTRKTGLRTHQKSYIQSLLNLPSPHELDPVLACLRSLIRKSVHESLAGDDIQKLFPIDLPIELQTVLVMFLQKYQNQWQDEASRDESPWKKTRISYQVKVSAPTAQAPLAVSETSSTIWPRQCDATCHFSRNDGGAPMPNIAVPNLPHMAPVSVQQDDGPADNLGNLPRLKSMTWTMQNQNSTRANRVAVINLKLQDYTENPSRETEVKFQLSRDTLEAMLRSMTYISEQLSTSVQPPLTKKQRQ